MKIDYNLQFNKNNKLQHFLNIENLSKEHINEIIDLADKYIKNKSNKFNRDEICDKLFRKGIETRPFFWPIHKQPIFKKFGKEILKNSEYLSKNGFYLPSGTALKNKEIRYIINEVKKIIK